MTESTSASVKRSYPALRVRLARVVRNTCDQAVTVRYDRPPEWTEAESIKVSDITESTERQVPVSVKRREIRWRAEPWHTYRVSY